VPIATALVGGFGTQIGAFAMEGIRGVTPIARCWRSPSCTSGHERRGLFDPLIRQCSRGAP